MQVIRVTAKAGPDGCFHLKLPLDAPDQLYDVAVVVSVRPPEGRTPTPEELGWPKDFLDNVMGAISDDTFVRHPQPEPRLVEPLDLDQ